MERHAATLALTVLLLLGAGSFWRIQRADTWWNKSISAGNMNVAHLANCAERPLVAARNGDIARGEIISLAYYLDEGFRMLGVPAGVERVQPGDLGDVFILTPDDELQNALGLDRHIQNIPGSWIWFFFPLQEDTISTPE